MKILVVGGTGALGRHVCREVVRTMGPEALVVGDYNHDRGREFARHVSAGVGGSAAATVVDVHDHRSVEHAVAGVDAVIVTVRQIEPNVQIASTARGIHSVDVVPDTPLAQAVFQVDSPYSGVVAAGLIPGLSGLMARQVMEEATARTGGLIPEAVHLSLLQRKNGTAGAAGIADMLGLFARPVFHHEQKIRGFTLRRTAVFPEPFGNRSVRLVAFPEGADVKEHFGVEHVHYWTAFDSDFFNGVVGLLNRLGFLNRFRDPRRSSLLARVLARSKKNDGAADETVALSAEAGGVVLGLTVRSDYTGTAMAAVAMARGLHVRGGVDYGVVLPFQLFTLSEIVSLIDSPDLVLSSPHEPAP